jgi:hypothetical protein
MIIGLKVKLDRPVDRERPCCRNLAVICECAPPHAGRLRCADCDQFRGWLSKQAAMFVQSAATRFGAPEIITVRKAHTFEEEAPHTEI